MKNAISKTIQKIGKIATLHIPVGIEYDLQKYSSTNKINQVLLHNNWAGDKRPVTLDEIWNAGFRNYSQFEEDGILLYIFSKIGMGNRLCLDIGAGDGINSNVANLIVNWRWSGLLIDGSTENKTKGEQYYATHPDTWGYPPTFKQAIVKAENINSLVENEFHTKDIDFCSIDIDGNDYWIWKALNVVNPKVVMLETHVEFGLEPIVVPYDPDYYYPGKHPQYHGASVTAMAKLAKEKGYRLIGSNLLGFNTIYMRNDIGKDIFPEVSPESVLSHQRNAERVKLFEPIKDWEYVRV